MKVHANQESYTQKDVQQPNPVKVLPSDGIQLSQQLIGILRLQTSQSLANCKIALENAHGNFAEAKKKLLECNSLVHSMLPTSCIISELFNRN